MVAEFIYADFTGELVVLELDGPAMEASGMEIKHEDDGDGDGELYPHIYGAVKCEWVNATYPASMADGKLVAPGLDLED